MLEIQFLDIVNEKHELGEINYIIKNQIKNEEDLFCSLKYKVNFPKDKCVRCRNYGAEPFQIKLFFIKYKIQ